VSTADPLTQRNSLMRRILDRRRISYAQALAERAFFARGKFSVLWLLVMAWVFRITVFFRRRPQGDYAEVDTFAAVQIVFVFLLAAYLVFSNRLTPLLRLAAKTSFGALMLYYGFGMVSAAWSPSPVFSFYRAFEVVVLSLGILTALSYCRSFSSTERGMLWMSLAIVLFQVHTNRPPPGMLFSFEAWKTNSYTAMSAMMFCYCVGEMLSQNNPLRQKFLLRISLAFLVLLILGHSTGSIVATICGLSVAFLLARRQRLAVIMLIAMIVVVGIAADINWQSLLLPGKAADYDVAGMSGRVGLWSTYFDFIMQHPLLGGGFDMLSQLVGFASNSHNAFIAVLGGTGLSGMIIIVIWIVRLFKETLAAVRARLAGSHGMAAGLITALVNSTTLAFLGEHCMTTTLVFACLVAFHMLFASRMAADGNSRILVMRWRKQTV
jgi:O-antigen ligase